MIVFCALYGYLDLLLMIVRLLLLPLTKIFKILYVLKINLLIIINFIGSAAVSVVHVGIRVQSLPY